MKLGGTMGIYNYKKKRDENTRKAALAYSGLMPINQECGRTISKRMETA